MFGLNNSEETPGGGKGEEAWADRNIGKGSVKAVLRNAG